MSGPGAAVSPEAYRAVMRHWPSGVTIVTMLDGERPHGMTASAFTSVSLHPPLVVIVVDKRWRSHGLIAAAGAFCVNILAADQAEVSDRFAGRHGELPDRFAGLATGRGATGAPYLASALAWLDCAVERSHDEGDHTLFVGRVVAAGVNRPDAEPLLYHDTRYRSLEPSPS
jgi:flavin reductase (DIM6/NTAB) family NADH-FMN oxidoreductase RutF